MAASPRWSARAEPRTTGLRAITGLSAARRIALYFDGEDVTRLPPHTKAARGLVLVPEGRQLFNNMSVEENLEMGAYSARARRHFDEQIERVFTLFPRLKERRRQKAGTFSGGEQQMLAIARGLMSAPDVLMIDELSLGLAPVVVQQLVSALIALRQTGLTLLLVEQNVHLALAISRLRLCPRRGAHFHRGSIEEGGRHAGRPQGLSRNKLRRTGAVSIIPFQKLAWPASVTGLPHVPGSS